MRTKLKTAVRTIQDLASDNSQRHNASKLEIGVEINGALSLLKIENPAPELYEIIDSYNASMMGLSPLNREIYPSFKGALSAGEIDSKREEVMSAYRLLADNYKSLPVAGSPENASNSLVAINNGISIYDSYLNLFNRLNERIGEIKPEDCGIALTKMVDFTKTVLNETYHNPQVDKLIKMRERGFKEQTLPDAKNIFLTDRITEFFSYNSSKINLDSNLKNEFFSKVFYINEKEADLVYATDNKNLALKGSLFGILNIDKGIEKNTPAYLIGEKIAGPVPKTEKELLKKANPVIYKNILGSSPPSYDELATFLERIHNFKGQELWITSKEQLEYPLNDEVFEIYCAAEDSDLFKKPNGLEFLVLKKKQKVIDPILNGKILGGQNLPICWWV